MAVILDKNTSAGNRGSHYNKGADYLYFVNEALGQIWRQPVNPATLVAQQEPRALISGRSNNVNSFGAADMRWIGGATKQVQAQGGAKVALLTGLTALDQVSAESLAAMDWDVIATNNFVGNEDGQAVDGRVYAMRIPVVGGEVHYAKLRIFLDGTSTKVEWVAYIVGTQPSLLHTLSQDYAAPRDVEVSAFDSEIYVSGGDGTNGYVIKIPRIIAGPFPQYSNFPTPLHDPSSPVGLLNPQQMVAEGGTFYVVAEDGLYLLQPEFAVQVQVVSGIVAPVGLLLDKQQSATTAYISNAAGQVFVVDISLFEAPTFDINGNPQTPSSAPIIAPAATPEFDLGGPSGYLTWADETHSAFYAAVGGAAGKVMRLDVVATSLASEVSAADPDLPAPWSVEVFDDRGATVVCDAAIYDLERGLLLSGDLPLGLGLIPFDFINNSKNNPATPTPTDGRADTSSVPGYYFSSNPNLAFGGSISLLINHQAAWDLGARRYRLTLTNDLTGQARTINNAFVDLRWNSTIAPPRFEGVSTAAQDGTMFPVRGPGDLWYNPYLAAILSTSLVDNGHNRLQIEFLDDAKIVIANYTHLIYLDNTRSSVSLSYLRRGTATVPPAPGDYQEPEACGLIAYDTKDDLIEFDLTAVHPSGIGKYALAFYRGATHLFTARGDLTEGATLQTVVERSPGVPLRVGHLTGDCDLANITMRLSAPSPGVINGYGWVSLSSSTNRSFTLAQPPLTHTDWPPVLRGRAAAPLAFHAEGRTPQRDNRPTAPTKK